MHALLPLAAVIFVAPTFAQQPRTPASLEEVLQGVEQFGAAADRAFNDRKTEFESRRRPRRTGCCAMPSQQKNQLSQASDKLSDTYQANELRISMLNQQLRDKAQSLGLAELFGLAHQAANDNSSILQQSLITTQFPPAAGQPARDEWLRQFAASRATPTATDLERLWVEIQREMTASGQVAKFRTSVVQPNGEPREVRGHPHRAVHGDLRGPVPGVLAELRTFNVLPRQLPGEFMSVAREFTNATSGYVECRRRREPRRADRTVRRADRRPSSASRPVRQSEPSSSPSASLGSWRSCSSSIYLVIVRLGVSGQLKHLDRPTANNPLGRVLLAFKGDKSKIEEDADVAELRITEAVLREVPKLERFQAFLRLCVAAGPLLGLIGTVVGMILTFQSITESGSSNPQLMANGIGVAMIATLLGLGVAIALLFANALLNSLSRGVVQILDEQSAGMLAESIEKQRRA
jgi:biopolymer transport protein ExbB